MDPLQINWLDALKPYGVAGILLAFFIVRDFLQGAREAKRADARDKQDAERERVRDEREAVREAQFAAMAKAVNHLTRAIALEVLTRPQVVQRGRDEANDLLNEVDQ